MEAVGAPLLHCSDAEFDKRISSMEVTSLLETVTFLQKEMASEQTRFDDMTSRLGQIPDAESPEYETLSAELMAVQANLASLMARNMKCFNQQTSSQHREKSDDTSNGTGSSDVELRNGDSVRLLNGHKKHRKVSPRLNRKPHRRPSYDDGEPDVAGYEESQGSGDEQNGNGNFLSLEFGSGGNGLLHVRGRRDFHSPDAQQQFIDFGPLPGETSTDGQDLVTVEKNKKNEQNEARVDDREQLEQKALRDLESLMRFEGDPEPPAAPSDPPAPRPPAHNKHPGRLFYIDNVTQGESYSDHQYKEIDVDRIGEEDEGEEDDPSEWKYAGDGDNKIPDGPIIHNTSGATAKIFAESLVRRRRLTDDDDDSDVTADKNDNDVYDVKRSTVTMVLRSGNDESSVSNGTVVNGSSKSRPEVTTMTSSAVVTLQSAPVLPAAATSSKCVASNGHDGEAGGAEGTEGGAGVSGSDCEQVCGGTGAAHQAGSDLSEAAPTTATPGGSTDLQQEDQNTPPPAPTTDSTPGIPSSTGGSSDTPLTDSSRGPPHTCRAEEEEQVPVVATSRVTLTLSPAPVAAPVPAPASTDTDPDSSRHPLLHAARVSLRTVSGADRPPVRTAPKQEQEEAGLPKDGPEYSSTTSSSVSTAKVHFRSYASFAPSEGGDEDRGDVGDADDLTDDPAPTQGAADDMGNTLDGAKGVKEGDSVSVKSAVTPACLPSEGFTADDLVKERTTLKDWDPTKLMQELYKIQLVPEEEEDFFEHITMEGYMEKLPINKKKATLLKTWKRRFFKAQEGYLHYYEPPDTVRPKTEDGKDSDKPSGSIQLMGGSIETLDNRMIGIDDGRGRYLVVRAPTEADCEDWCRALKSQTIENIKASWVKPVVHAIPSRRRNVVIIDIGSCSVRAGVLGENPSLPSLFFPCIMATSKDTGERVFGFEALLPESRANCTLSYPVRPSVKVDKNDFAVDMAAIPELFDKIFNDLNVDPSKHWVMFSAPGNFSDKIKQHFMDILVNRFHVIGVNIVAQTLLSLYSYNSRSGIVVDVGERLEIVPVTDGYIVEAGVTRQPYGGHRITEALNSSFTESKYRFFTDVEFQIVRLAMEKSCYVATDYNAESRKCQQNPRPFKKTIHLEQFGLPSGTWKNVTHTQSRFSTTEGLFNTEMWGMDNPMMHKLVAKAVQVCPMDMRREIWRSIFLSGGVTLLPGFAERLQEELTKLAPPSVKVQVHASPQRYHSAYIGACALANLQEFEQACISADEWRETGPPCLRKWHMY